MNTTSPETSTSPPPIILSNSHDSNNIINTTNPTSIELASTSSSPPLQQQQQQPTTQHQQYQFTPPNTNTFITNNPNNPNKTNGGTSITGNSSNNINNNSNGKKQVTIQSGSAVNGNTKLGQSQVGFGQPSESGKSGSSFSQSKITLRTCCGVVELTSMKLACLLGMLVTVIGLLVLAGVAIAAFATASTKATDILIAVGKVTSLFESSNAVVLKHVYTGYVDEPSHSAVINEFKNKTADMKSTLLLIFKTCG
ncbi:predicted protein [Naegleria gruberi]|uniref:Predicted protein n=1 Tax=Naegleria gruberi TaxID=5762 RepID=D2W5E5_NAEGR|nr:uncharacterized protein NAEGRDRAFT_82353 [Naegleria gruberi]EFC35707.1 predicted protein [Naegleria gruberi]|eukprot:XP_002668451.1 predicted protein [Naegleria gruberi strain NEG-M]